MSAMKKRWLRLLPISEKNHAFVLHMKSGGSKPLLMTSERSLTSYQEESKIERVKSISEMPGLKSYPIIGSLLSVVFKKELYQNKLHVIWEDVVRQFGSCAKIKFPGLPPAVIISRPDDVATLFKETMNNPVREAFHSLKKVRYEASDNYFEGKGGILIENNEEWKRVRSQVQTPLLRPQNLHRYIPAMDEVALEFMDRIALLQKKYGEMPSDFEEELYKWALESVGLVALNRRLGCLDSNLTPNSASLRLIETVNSIVKCLTNLEMKFQLWRLIETPSYRKLKGEHENLLRIVAQSIKENEEQLKLKMTEKSEESTSDLSLLETLLKKEGLSRMDVVTFMLDLFLAGIDTTSHTIAFTLYLLAKNPEAQGRLQEEIDSVLGREVRPIDEKHLAKLSYLKSCIKESLRLFPLAIGLSRALTENTAIGGYLIPKGYRVLILNTIACKDGAYFPRPNEYLPERWLRSKPFGEIHPYASLPFSHGPRMCIGRRIAEQEINIFLARAMQRFTVDYKYNDFEMIMRFVTVPSEPLKFQFTERN